MFSLLFRLSKVLFFVALAYVFSTSAFAACEFGWYNSIEERNEACERIVNPTGSFCATLGYTRYAYGGPLKNQSACALPAGCSAPEVQAVIPGAIVGPDGQCIPPPPPECPPGHSWDGESCQPDPCPYPNQVRNPETGVCNCKILNPHTLDCAASCSEVAGGGFGRTNEALVGHRSSQGCEVQCALQIGGDGLPVWCVFTGREAREGSVADEESVGEEAPEGAEPAPEDEDGQPLPCPKGQVQGYVNGQRVCAPGGGRDPDPEVNPTEEDPTGLGAKFDALKKAVEDTKQNVAETGTAINRQTALLGAKLDEIASKVGQGGGGGGGGGGGDDGPPGECDPEAKDYWDCLSGEPSALEHTEAPIETFEEALDDFVSRVSASDIGQAASRLSGSVNSGSCPTASFALFGQTFVIDQHCDIFEEVRNVLSVVMSAVWVALGILILLSA